MNAIEIALRKLNSFPGKPYSGIVAKARLKLKRDKEEKDELLRLLEVFLPLCFDIEEGAISVNASCNVCGSPLVYLGNEEFSCSNPACDTTRAANIIDKTTRVVKKHSPPTLIIQITPDKQNKGVRAVIEFGGERYLGCWVNNPNNLKTRIEKAIKALGFNSKFNRDDILCLG